jgi:hypothetical protein
MRFLKTLEETTPEIIGALRGRPVEVLAELAAKYNGIGPHELGALTCEWDGQPALAARPMWDLAMMICSPERERPANPWPPSALLWDASMRTSILEIARVMQDWAENFRRLNRVHHWRVIDAGLETMRTWAQDPALATKDMWWGLVEVTPSQQMEAAPIELAIPGWDPLKESETDFLARVAVATAGLKKWAREVVSSVKPMLVKLDSKRNPEHFNWAALRLVRQLTFREIADEWQRIRPQNTEGFDDGAIRKGVQSTLKALGLRDIHANRK